MLRWSEVPEVSGQTTVGRDPGLRMPILGDRLSPVQLVVRHVSGKRVRTSNTSTTRVLHQIPLWEWRHFESTMSGAVSCRNLRKAS